MEEWRDIIGYEGLYQVSNLGRVKSLNYNHTGKEGILDTEPTSSGYVQVNLYKNNKRKTYLVHRLVAQSFIPNPLGLPEVNHIIDDFEHRSDNRVENLEWCTKDYNINYGNRNKRASENRTYSLMDNHPQARKIICITTGETFNCIKEASEKYNILYQNISSCCRGERKSAGKHPITGEKLVWKYV